MLRHSTHTLPQYASCPPVRPPMRQRILVQQQQQKLSVHTLLQPAPWIPLSYYTAILLSLISACAECLYYYVCTDSVLYSNYVLSHGALHGRVSSCSDSHSSVTYRTCRLSQLTISCRRLCLCVTPPTVIQHTQHLLSESLEPYPFTISLLASTLP